jgi:PAS domain S-box-containing protein
LAVELSRVPGGGRGQGSGALHAGGNPFDFALGGGETGALILDKDWSRTPLGPIGAWPQSLRTALGIVLNSSVPLVLLWGEDGVMLYNDAYSAFAGGRHPELLGSNVRDGWPEVADFNDNVMKVGLSGRTLAYRDQELTLFRDGYPEPVWMNLDYSPVYDETGQPGGVIAVVVETTEQVLATRALRTERDRMRDVLERMGDGFMLLDRDFYVLEINVQGLRTDGRRRDEIIGRNHWTLWPGSHDSELGRAYRRAMTERMPQVAQITHTPGDGRERRVEVRCYPVADGLAIFFREISDQWRAEQKLMLSEESLRLATEAAEVGVWDLDLTTDVLTWSKRTKAAFGIGPLVSCSMADFYAGLHPDDLAATSEAFAAAIDPERRAFYDVEYRTVGKEDGVIRWVAAKGKGLFDDDGRCTRAIGTAIDITERKADSERLRVSEAKLRELNATLEKRVRERTRERDSAWNNTQDLLAVVDADGRLRAVNPSWERILGLAPEGVVGRRLEEIVWPDDGKATRAAFGQAREEVLTQFENRLRHKDGGFRWISWMAATDENGLFYASGRDITVERDAREALFHAEEALMQSQKMEAVGQLTGGIAHDFNNLLTIIQSSADFLRRPDLNPERRGRYVEAIAETSERAAKLTAQLLAFARRQTLQPEVFDAGARVRSIAEMIRPLVGARIHVDIEEPRDPVFVEADISQFETSLLNLAINGRDAMEDGGKLKLVVRCAEDPDTAGRPSVQGAWVAVDVIDTGLGIPPQALPHIFEPFFTTKEVGKGTGLGLSQVFGFAKQSGGEVTVESQPGRGSRFSIYLPRSREPQSSLVEDELSVSTQRTFQGARVLVVEDNSSVGAFSSQMLQDMGCRTTLASNAVEALGLVEANPAAFDMIFSDVVMPGMSGVELAQTLRSRWPDLPVLLTSGYSDVLAKEGAHGFPLLHKPYSVETMARVLRQVAVIGAAHDRARGPSDPIP